jgi:hypothetical protein
MMTLKWKVFSGFVVGLLFIPLVVMIDKYVGPGAGTMAISMLSLGICVASCVWLIEMLGKIK